MAPNLERPPRSLLQVAYPERHMTNSLSIYIYT